MKKETQPQAEITVICFSSLINLAKKTSKQLVKNQIAKSGYVIPRVTSYRLVQNKIECQRQCQIILNIAAHNISVLQKIWIDYPDDFKSELFFLQ